MKNLSLAYFSAITVVCIWSGWIILSRLGVNSNLTPSDITMLRFGTAAVVTLPFSLRFDWKKYQWYQILLLALGCGFPYTMFSFFGLKILKAANAGVLVNGMLPVMGALFAYYLFKEKLSWKKWLAVGVLLAANMMMIDWSQFSSTKYWGVFLLLSAAFVFSIYMASVKKWTFAIKDVIAIVPIVNTILFLPVWFFSESNIQQAEWNLVILQVFYQGIIVSVFALILITYTVNKLGAGTMSVYLSYVPVVTALFGWVFLNEQLTLLEVSSIVICTVGLWLYARS
ncbi:MAG: DMT family transporter [Cytophagaceae bacterium]